MSSRRHFLRWAASSGSALEMQGLAAAQDRERAPAASRHEDICHLNVLTNQIGYPARSRKTVVVESNPDTHAALTTAETMIRGMNVGVAGFAVWTILNPCNIDGAWEDRVGARRQAVQGRAPLSNYVVS